MYTPPLLFNLIDKNVNISCLPLVGQETGNSLQVPNLCKLHKNQKGLQPALNLLEIDHDRYLRTRRYIKRKRKKNDKKVNSKHLYKLLGYNLLTRSLIDIKGFNSFMSGHLKKLNDGSKEEKLMII